MHIQRTTRLSPDAKARWIAALPDTSPAVAGIDLCEALQDSSTSVSVCYLEAFSGEGEPLALALVHTIHDLDLGSYVGGVAQQLFGAAGALGWRPLRMDVTFLEIPFCNLPGLLLTREGERREPEVVTEIVRFARGELACDIFAVKTYDQQPREDTLARLGMLHASFPANTSLPIRFSSFDEYVKSLPKDWRSNVHANRKRFASMNGTVTRVTDLESAARTTADLFHSTTSFHQARGDMGRPLDIDEKFLRCLNRTARPENRFLVTCEVNGHVATAGLVLRSGRQLIAVKAGMNYELAKSSRSYFNFYYSTIEYAIEHRLDSIQLCAETYDVKRRMGGVAGPVSYYFDLNSRWVAPIVKLVVKHFAAQRGAAAQVATA